MNHKSSFLLLIIGVLITSCQEKIVKGSSPLEVFDAFWTVMDERYVYFEEKKLDWDSVYSAYRPKVEKFKSEEELIPVLKEIIERLKDQGTSIHYNQKSIIYSGTDISFAYFKVPSDKYGFNRYKEGQLVEKLTNESLSLPHQNQRWLYVYLSQFSPYTNLKDFQYFLEGHDYQDGLILDIRCNTAGDYKDMADILAMLYKGNKIIYYKTLKQSKQHNHFADSIPFTYQGRGGINESIPIVILTDKITCSTATIFAAAAKTLPNVTIIGERTRGGAASSEYIYLPNSWILHYTADKLYSPTFENIELGVVPDIEVPYNYEKDTTDFQLLKAMEILLLNTKD